MEWPSKHFTPPEILSPYGEYLLEVGQLVINLEAVSLLESLRDKIQTPILVNHGPHRLRGFRSPEEQRMIYARQRLSKDEGSPGFVPGDNRFGYHLMGRAFDIQAPSLHLRDLYQAALEAGFKGVGKYDSFIHVDNRLSDKVIGWDNRSFAGKRSDEWRE
jgi:hypothetical protein